MTSSKEIGGKFRFVEKGSKDSPMKPKKKGFFDDLLGK